MAVEKLFSSEQFMQEVLDHHGSALVIFPGASSLISDFVIGQAEVVGQWREDLKVLCYTPSNKKSDDSSSSGTLIALYFEGVFVAATSKYCFAEHLDAWYETSLAEYHRLGSEEE